MPWLAPITPPRLHFSLWLSTKGPPKRNEWMSVTDNCRWLWCRRWYHRLAPIGFRLLLPPPTPSLLFFFYACVCVIGCKWIDETFFPFLAIGTSLLSLSLSRSFPPPSLLVAVQQTRKDRSCSQTIIICIDLILKKPWRILKISNKSNIPNFMRQPSKKFKRIARDQNQEWPDKTFQKPTKIIKYIRHHHRA